MPQIVDIFKYLYSSLPFFMLTALLKQVHFVNGGFGRWPKDPAFVELVTTALLASEPIFFFAHI